MFDFRQGAKRTIELCIDERRYAIVVKYVVIPIGLPFNLWLNIKSISIELRTEILHLPLHACDIGSDKREVSGVEQVVVDGINRLQIHHHEIP